MFCACLILLCLSVPALAKEQKVITLTSQNWREVLQGEWMIKFYAPWCPACRSMADDYKRFADWSDDLSIKVAEVDINEETGLSGRFIVTALPTIYQFVEDKLWRGTDPLAWYRHPDSVPMMLMCYMFQTSMVIKVFHETLTEKYGFSSTTSYVIFGIATVAIGLLLGLALVVVIECVAPQKAKAQEKLPESNSVPQSADTDSADETGAESSEDDATGSEKAKDHESSASDNEIQSSAPVSQSSSRVSQEWEKVIRDEEGEQNFTDDTQQKEEGQGELRRRKVEKEKGEE